MRPFRSRLPLLLTLLAVLALATWAALRSVAGTGAYLTAEGDWQALAGEYRIGTIDYTVKLNNVLLVDRVEGGADPEQKLRLALPVIGGVKIFDSTVTAAIREKEFNEGVTLVRVRVANYSKSTVDVTAQFVLQPPDSPIMALPLPLALDETAVKNLNYRKYVLDTLGGPTDLADLTAAYGNYIKNPITLAPGLISGATAAGGVQYKDVFLIVWSEYGADYDGPGKVARQARFDATFTVGQLE